MKLLFCGDWHGEPSAATNAAKIASQQDCRIVVQCGDFGFWPHLSPDYVHLVNKNLMRYDISMVWVDGNHENFDVLFSTEWPRSEHGFSRIADRIYYAPRGHRWEWDGVRFLALGGGYSIDKDWRLSKGPEGMYWWRQETITQADVVRCGTDPVEVMVTHDMPSGAELGIALHHNSREDEWNRKAVRAVVDAVKPRMLFHGHYHYSNSTVLEIEEAPPVKIEALDMYKGLPLKSHYRVLDLGDLS